MNKTFSERLRNGEKLYGTLITSPSPRWPEYISKLGLDFLFIDTEHIALDRQQLSWMCQTYRALGLNPIVRILSHDPNLACAALDGGACGIVAPYIETPEQARQLVGAVKYRPVKGRKLENLLSNTDPPSKQLSEYLNTRAVQNTLILNIESVEGIHRMDEILEVEGIDGILIGPHDLSCCMEIPEDYRNPKFIEAVNQIIRQARAKGLGAGIHCIMGEEGIDLELQWIESGANFILHSADIMAAIGALRKEFTLLKAGRVSLDSDQLIPSTPINI